MSYVQSIINLYMQKSHSAKEDHNQWQSINPCPAE